MHPPLEVLVLQPHLQYADFLLRALKVSLGPLEILTLLPQLVAQLGLYGLQLMIPQLDCLLEVPNLANL